MDGSKEKVNLRTVGIIGYGNFGAFIHLLLKRFAPKVRVLVFEPKKEQDGEVFVSLKDAAQCDAVILAVPISVFERVLKRLIPLARKDTVIVDVSTVKSYTHSLLKKYAPDRFVSTHPMWGPESYKKRDGDVSGFRIVVAGHTLPPEVFKALCASLESFGFKVLHIDAEAHDKSLAETLFLTHFIGQVVSKAGFVRTDIDTVSFGYLMDAVESVRADKKLFKDVFRYDPYCKAVIKKFSISETAVRKLLK